VCCWWIRRSRSLVANEPRHSKSCVAAFQIVVADEPRSKIGLHGQSSRTDGGVDLGSERWLSPARRPNRQRGNRVIDCHIVGPHRRTRRCDSLLQGMTCSSLPGSPSVDDVPDLAGSRCPIQGWYASPGDPGYRCSPVRSLEGHQHVADLRSTGAPRTGFKRERSGCACFTYALRPGTRRHTSPRMRSVHTGWCLRRRRSRRGWNRRTGTTR